MFRNKDKERIEDLEDELKSLKGYFSRLLAREDRQNLIIDELCKRCDLVHTEYYLDPKFAEELRKTHELLHEADGWRLWSKRKK